VLRARGKLAPLALVCALALILPATLDASPPPTYYVVLGDSLARGWQPNSAGHDVQTAQGYAEDVYRALRRNRPSLRLVNLGCGGETTASMSSGTICHYIAGSQIEQAEAFIESHPGAITAVSINIGDNDVEGCFKNSAFDNGCLSAGYAAVRSKLPGIAAGLRTAAGPSVPIIGLSDYDQFLALWLQGPQGQALARQSVGIITRLNDLVQAIYRRSRIAVADASSRFATTDLHDYRSLSGHGSVPLAVARICSWTWACSPAPIGFDDHANASGYGVLAQSILVAFRNTQRRHLTRSKSPHIPR
jgi:lysophospholipase L1-like esterase